MGNGAKGDSFRFQEDPSNRRIRIIGHPEAAYDEADRARIEGDIEAIKAKSEGLVREAFVYVEQPIGKLAVGMIVRGVHEQLHSLANRAQAALTTSSRPATGTHWHIDH